MAIMIAIIQDLLVLPDLLFFGIFFPIFFKLSHRYSNVAEVSTGHVYFVIENHVLLARSEFSGYALEFCS